jgi:uncharacterized YigZ family protein
LSVAIHTYRTLAQPNLSEYKDKGSRFIAYAEAVETMQEVRLFLERIQTEHPKATHHCYAYRLGLDKQSNYRANDDGEPAGSAGRPILGQIDSKGLSNIMVIVVRYFGGTKLGVPGLISAYKTATAQVLNEAVVEERELRQSYQIRFTYMQMNEVMQAIKREPSVALLQQQFDNECALQLSVAQADSARLLTRLHDIDQIQVTPLLDV